MLPGYVIKGRLSAGKIHSYAHWVVGRIQFLAVVGLVPVVCLLKVVFGFLMPSVFSLGEGAKNQQ